MDSLQEIYIKDLPTDSPAREPGIPKPGITQMREPGITQISARCARNHAVFRCAHACISEEFATVIEMGTISTVLALDTRIIHVPESYSTNNRFYQLIDQACTYMNSNTTCTKME